MRVCLINPEYVHAKCEEDEFNISGYTVPHLGLGYIASYLINRGYQTDIYECMEQNILVEDFKTVLEANKYDIYGISLYADNLKYAIKLICKIKRMNPNSIIFVGGYLATLQYESVMRTMPQIDYCVVGEGEITTCELVSALENKEDITKIKGIAYRCNTEVFFTGNRELIKNLDILPFPIRSFVSKSNIITMSTSRGCYNKCIYCSIIEFYKNGEGKCYRIRSAKNIVDEIEYLISKYKDIWCLWIFDDNFLAPSTNNIKRINELYNLMKQRNIRVPFYITACCRDVILRKEELKLLKEIGLEKVFIGIESFCQRQLDYYKKNVTFEENIEAYKILEELKFKINIGFIPLDPFVTLDEIIFSFTILKKYKMRNDSWAPFSISMQVKAVENTEMNRMLKHENLYVRNEKGYNFANEEIEYLYTVIKRWNDIFMPMVEKGSVIIQAEKKKKMEEKIVLEESMDNLFELDIDFVLEICKTINKYEIYGQYIEEIIDKFSKRFQAIYEKYIVYSERVVNL